MVEFKLKIAGLVVAILSRFDNVKTFCSNYITESEDEDLAIFVTDEKLHAVTSREGYSFKDDYAESTCIYREIAESLPEYDRIVFHGAAITYRDKAYIFTAPSGTGKSTHIRLWKKHLGRAVGIINGDKPILKISEDGTEVYGCPWSGKENWNRNCSAPLAGICILKQSKTNRITKISASDELPLLITQTYIPRKAGARGCTFDLLEKLFKNLPVYVLECDISEEAVKLSFEALTGEKYKKDL